MGCDSPAASKQQAHIGANPQDQSPITVPVRRKELEWLAMKIDSGTSGSRYPTPPYYGVRKVEDKTATEETAKAASANAAISKTYLSSSLASALWTVERERKSAANNAPAEDATEGPNGGILGRYLEFEGSDEFH